MSRIEKWNEITGAEQEQGMMEAFFESRTDSYAILQLRDIDETRQEQFASLDYLHRQGKEPDIDHYEIVYTDNLPAFIDRDTMLESLYTKFNIDHPADFTGHSLSVSDIVALKTGGVVSCHYVDSVGFTELKDFLRAGNHLKNAEMTLEDDKMYFFILGFHFLVWWPKCTPASSSCFMVMTAIFKNLRLFLPRARKTSAHQPARLRFWQERNAERPRCEFLSRLF